MQFIYVIKFIAKKKYLDVDNDVPAAELVAVARAAAVVVPAVPADK